MTARDGQRRGQRRRLLARRGAIAVIVVGLAFAAGPASAASPVRSGTILVPVRPASPLGPMRCEYTPDCRAFLATCTDRTTTRMGASASVVDVAKLAGRTTTRTFAVVARTLAVAGGVTVEFWDARCQQVSVPHLNVIWARFRIPAGAVWMTVVPGTHWVYPTVGGVALRWELR